MQYNFKKLKDAIKDWAIQKGFILEKEEKHILFYKDEKGKRLFAALVCKRIGYENLIRILKHFLTRLSDDKTEDFNGYILIPINSLSSVLKEYTKRLGIGIMEIDLNAKTKIIVRAKKRVFVRELKKNEKIKSKESIVKPDLTDNINIINFEEFSQFLDLCDEDEFTRTIVEPFLTKIGFENVSVKGHRDRRMEFGQDLNMKYKLPTDHYLYFAAQVKLGKISGSDVPTLLSQLECAKKKKIFDNCLNIPVGVDHVFLISGGYFSEDAKVLLREELENRGLRDTIIIDRGDLIKIGFREKLPIPSQDEIRQYLEKRRLENK